MFCFGGYRYSHLLVHRYFLSFPFLFAAAACFSQRSRTFLFFILLAAAYIFASVMSFNRTPSKWSSQNKIRPLSSSSDFLSAFSSGHLTIASCPLCQETPWCVCRLASSSPRTRSYLSGILTWFCSSSLTSVHWYSVNLFVRSGNTCHFGK